MARAKAVMVLGTTSGAGKSWLTTALCRWYARQGLRVAPFTAQNMSNNARVVPGLDGAWGEIGSAQYFQARAARVTPHVWMNPVLLKPEADCRSQVIVNGQVRPDLMAVPWRERSEQLWPHARQALDALMARHDLVVLEGAGSPAEINLHANDYVNMRSAKHAQAACLVVTDIDRGGAFAHLFGTHQLLPPDERALIRGFVLNRFRGDASLLAPGPEMLQQRTGVPTVGVLPMWRGHGLPEEDGLYDEAWDAATGPTSGPRVAIVAYPSLSNLDEFQPLRQTLGRRLIWARSAEALRDTDWIILPGSKHTLSDLRWLRTQGMDQVILQHAAQGGRVLGICGGLQMLGQQVLDAHGMEGGQAGCEPGLGLLDIQTELTPHKRLKPTQARFVLPTNSHVSSVWDALQGDWVQGYEIHLGETKPTTSDGATQVWLLNEDGEALGWQRGSVAGLYVHGLFENAPVTSKLLDVSAPDLDTTLDGLADFIDRHMQADFLMQLAQA